MHEQADLVGITFSENGDVDVAQLNALYRLIGWDCSRTPSIAIAALRLGACRVWSRICSGLDTSR